MGPGRRGRGSRPAEAGGGAFGANFSTALRSYCTPVAISSKIVLAAGWYNRTNARHDPLAAAAAAAAPAPTAAPAAATAPALRRRPRQPGLARALPSRRRRGRRAAMHARRDGGAQGVGAGGQPWRRRLCRAGGGTVPPRRLCACPRRAVAGGSEHRPGRLRYFSQCRHWHCAELTLQQGGLLIHSPGRCYCQSEGGELECQQQCQQIDTCRHAL